MGVVERSAEVNHTQLVGKQNGKVVVPTYNWADGLHPHFKKSALKGIKQYHHFHFNGAKPGKVYAKKYSDEPEKEIQLLVDPKWRPSASDLPEVVQPAGLPIEQQRYLFEKNREFCPSYAQDLVCPNPDATDTAAEVSQSPQGRNRMAEQSGPDAAAGRPEELAPPAKKLRLYSNCRGSGHNRRSCPQLH